MIIDPVVYSSRPSEKRSPEEEKCYDFLEELGVPFTRVDHEHADTIEACLEVEKILGCEICKNLLLTNRQMSDLYLLLMPGNKPFRTKFLSKQLGCA
ncbi:MAG: prolyl-tRNA synthetase associated domain-containing protein, partial [Oscillospiraceae bacterium]|nr:prolyl-tRNA synthetase associated domain-containing protein [Oscillospiraceae bacterium]